MVTNHSKRQSRAAGSFSGPEAGVVGWRWGKRTEYKVALPKLRRGYKTIIVRRGREHRMPSQMERDQKLLARQIGLAA
jgi:hypothetical protein